MRPRLHSVYIYMMVPVIRNSVNFNNLLILVGCARVAHEMKEMAHETFY